MKINFVGGNGVMGKVHIPLLEKAGHVVIITGRNSEISMEEAAKICDLTIISVPVKSTSDILEKIAPFCRAIVDFTSLKEFPIKKMLKFSRNNCEICGLHPLYGEVNDLYGKTIVYCDVRIGEKIKLLLEDFEKAGLKLLKMAAKEHDYFVQGQLQNLRVKILKDYTGEVIKTAKELGLSIKEVYALSPPPTKILLDLVARQLNEDNDEMYFYLSDLNESMRDINSDFIKCFKNSSYDKKDLDEMRAFFAEELDEARNRSKKNVN